MGKRPKLHPILPQTIYEIGSSIGGAENAALNSYSQYELRLLALQIRRFEKGLMQYSHRLGSLLVISIAALVLSTPGWAQTSLDPNLQIENFVSGG
jgi:hypothetical protein